MFGSDPPPLVWELFPHNPVFLSENVPNANQICFSTVPVVALIILDENVLLVVVDEIFYCGG